MNSCKMTIQSCKYIGWARNVKSEHSIWIDTSKSRGNVSCWSGLTIFHLAPTGVHTQGLTGRAFQLRVGFGYWKNISDRVILGQLRINGYWKYWSFPYIISYLTSIVSNSVWRNPKSEQNRTRNFFPMPIFFDTDTNTFFFNKFFPNWYQYFFEVSKPKCHTLVSNVSLVGRFGCM